MASSLELQDGGNCYRSRIRNAEFGTELFAASGRCVQQLFEPEFSMRNAHLGNTVAAPHSISEDRMELEHSSMHLQDAAARWLAGA